MAAPLAANTQASPFGVLLRFTLSGRTFMCSAFHLKPGVVLTGAHCVSGYRNLGTAGFRLVYFDKQGRQTASPIQGFEYVGNERADDFAILTMPSEIASDWDDVPGKVTALPKTQEVTVWSFDPVEMGMQFSPKHCAASEKIPVLNGVSRSGEKEDLLKVTDSKESLHLFLDDCDKTLRSGNSGGLVTRKDDLSEIYGVYHWGVKASASSIENFPTFEYLGSSGILRKIVGESRNYDLFGVAYALVHSLK